MFQEVFAFKSEQYALLCRPCLYPAWAKIQHTHLAENLALHECVQHHFLTVIGPDLDHDATG